VGQTIAQAGAHYRRRAGQAQARADLLRALPRYRGQAGSVRSLEAERDLWVRLADEIDRYLRGDLRTEVAVGPQFEDVSMF
jgi:hypothetical protein